MNHRTSRCLIPAALSPWVSLVLCASFLFGDSGQEQTSRTFMYPRPLHHAIATSTFIWQDILGRKDPDFHGAFRVLPIYQEARSPAQAARYQLLNCQTSILIAGDAAPAKNTRDVRAEYLGLASDFQGTLSLAPTHRQGGALLSFTHNISHWLDWSWLNNLWLICNIPVVVVSQNICPREHIMQQGAPNPNGPATILQAVNQPNYRFGKIADTTITRGGLGVVELGIGATWISQRGFLLWYESSFDIPGSSRTEAEYLWTPTIGINGHIGWSNELAFSLPLEPDHSSYHIRLVGNMVSHYLFSHRQQRVFDLKHKPWSRYLPLVNQRTGEIQPGLNVLSRGVEVHPRNFVNLSGALLFEQNGWYAQAGYALWVHRTEKLEFLQPSCSSNAGTAVDITMWGIAGSAPGSTASKSTIYEQAGDDSEFVHLYLNDINLKSGASQEAFTQAFHVQLGYHNPCGYYATCGASVEQAHRNSALNLWGVWGSIGVLW